jgi:hypothetical protein
MRKVSFIAKFWNKKLNILIVGIGLSANAMGSLERASASGFIRLYGSNKLIGELKERGCKAYMKPFDDEIQGAIIGYPNSGLPAVVSEGLTAITEVKLQLLTDHKKTVFHGVFSEFENLSKTEVEGTVTYNVTDALNKAIDGHRITMTRFEQLDKLTATITEMKGEFNEEWYEAVVTNNSWSTVNVVAAYYTSTASGLKPEADKAEKTLAKLSQKAMA